MRPRNVLSAFCTPPLSEIQSVHLLICRTGSGSPQGVGSFVEKRHTQILLVEDNGNDAALFRRAVRRIDPEAVVCHVADASAASVYLKQDGLYPDAPRPDIIVCDSILDSESGLDLLRWVRRHPRFEDLPFVILSGSSSPHTREKLAELGATAFFHKPADTEVFRETIRQILLHVLPRE